MPKPITVDALCDLVEDLAVSDLAAAAGPELEDLVGGWGRVTSVSAAVETTTFAASGSAAAMQAGLTIRRRDEAPVLRTATITATMDGAGRITLDRVDVRPDDGDASDAPRRLAMVERLIRARRLCEDGEVRIDDEDAELIIALLCR